jgi:hypothetical protein
MADRLHPPMPEEVDTWSSLSVRSPTHAQLLLVASGYEPVRARAGSIIPRGLHIRVSSPVFSSLSFSSSLTYCSIVYIFHFFTFSISRPR